MTSHTQADEVLSRLELFGTRLGLETTRRVLESMSKPHLELSPVLIAGTNGKGSVAAMLSAIGSAAGYTTGLFSSPHLENVTERLRVDGRSIAAAELGELLADVTARSQAVAGVTATYFEALFVAACRWFLEQNTDIVMVEVGLGGRLDATNASEPVMSVITEIALEHTEYLGNTVEEIAREKAGILRKGKPAVLGVRNKEALQSLFRAARHLGVPYSSVADRIDTLDVSENSDWSQRVHLRSARDEYRCHLPLAGQHQVENLRTVVAAAETLAELGWARIDRSAIESGVERCSWPGRLERVETDGRAPVVLDAAHNPHAARSLARFLTDRLPGFALLFGVLGDKEADEMLPYLSEIAAEVVLCRPRSSRSRDPHALGHWSRCPETVVIERPRRALDAVLASGRPVVVCGSIYLVGEVRGMLRERFGIPPLF